MIERRSEREVVCSGRLVTLCYFSDSNITSEYIGWLNDQKVVKFSNQRFRLHNAQTCQSYLNSFKNTDNMFLAIYQDANFVGTMTAYVSTIHKTADMGIMIGDAQSWGKGIGQDAWMTLMRHLFERCGIRKVTGGTLKCNAAMVRIMLKSGMKPDGVRVAHELVDGEPQDVLHFAKFDI